MSASSSTASGSPAWAASVTSGPVSRVDVAADPGLEVVGHRGVGQHQLARVADQRVARGVLLPAAPVAALAAVAVRHDLHVPELAGHAVLATEHLVVDHQRAADAGPERDAQDVAVTDARAEPALRERGGVRVVVHHHRARRSAASARPAAARRARPGAARTARSRGRRRRTRPPRCRPPRRRTAALRVSTSSTMVSSTSRTLRPGVGRRWLVSTVPKESTTPARTLVPPMSMPIVSGPGRPIIARRVPWRSVSGMVARLLRGRHTPSMRPLRRTAVVVLTIAGHRAGRLPRPGLRRDREGAAPAERARLQRRPGRRPHGHVDPDRRWSASRPRTGCAQSGSLTPATRTRLYAAAPVRCTARPVPGHRDRAAGS